MLTLVLLLSLQAPPTQDPIKLATTGITVVNLDEKLGLFYTQHLAQQLTFQKNRVVTPREIEAIVGIERQRQLLGCSDEQSSCLAELAGALGVDAMVLGDIGRIGKVYQVNLRISSAGDGRVLTAYSARVASEEALLDALAAGAREMSVELRRVLRPGSLAPSNETAAANIPVGAVTAAPSVSRPFRPYAWIPAALGAALAGGGVFFLTRAATSYRKLTGPTAPAIDGPTATQLQAAGATSQTLGWAGVIAGTLGLGASAAMFFWPGDPPTPDGADRVSLSVVPLGSGMTFQLSGALP